jgi:hypothetical protein
MAATVRQLFRVMIACLEGFGVRRTTIRQISEPTGVNTAADMRAPDVQR